MADNGTNGRGMWKTDGTTNGTVPVDGATFVPFGMTAFNNEYYYVDDGDGNGNEIWKTDGTLQGTARITDINPGAGSSDPTELTVFNNELYFRATDGATGYELWKTTNGTSSGAVQVAAGLPNPHGLTVFEDELYFTADGGTTGWGIWKIDGSSSDTTQIANMGGGLTVFNNELYFVSVYGSEVPEVWKTRGTFGSTERVTYFDLYEYGGPEIKGVRGSLFVGGDFLLFPGNDSTHGIEPWVIRVVADVTPENLAQVIADLPSGTTEVEAAATSSNLNGFLTAIAALPENTGDTIDIVLNLTEGDYEGAVIDVPAGYRVLINGDSEQVVFHGASPALTLLSGDVRVTGVTFVNSTDAASIVVNGGSLAVRNSVIQETTGGAQSALQVNGGSADLGILADPGGNTLVLSGPGEFLRNLSQNEVPLFGNVFQTSSATITSDFVVGPQQRLIFDEANGDLKLASIVLTVGIDLRPPTLNIDQNGAISLVIFGSTLFDVTQISTSSLRFAGVSIDVFNSTLNDDNSDGKTDLLIHFHTSDALKEALRDLYSDLLLEDEADDGQYATQQNALIALDGAFGDFGQEFHGTDSTTLFLAGKSLKTLLASLGI